VESREGIPSPKEGNGSKASRGEKKKKKPINESKHFPRKGPVPPSTCKEVKSTTYRISTRFFTRKEVDVVWQKRRREKKKNGNPTRREVFVAKKNGNEGKDRCRPLRKNAPRGNRLDFPGRRNSWEKKIERKKKPPLRRNRQSLEGEKGPG